MNMVSIFVHLFIIFYFLGKCFVTDRAKLFLIFLWKSLFMIKSWFWCFDKWQVFKCSLPITCHYNISSNRFYISILYLEIYLNSSFSLVNFVHLIFLHKGLFSIKISIFIYISSFLIFIYFCLTVLTVVYGIIWDLNSEVEVTVLFFL